MTSLIDEVGNIDRGQRIRAAHVEALSAPQFRQSLFCPQSRQWTLQAGEIKIDRDHDSDRGEIGCRLRSRKQQCTDRGDIIEMRARKMGLDFAECRDADDVGIVDPEQRLCKGGPIDFDLLQRCAPETFDDDQIDRREAGKEFAEPWLAHAAQFMHEREAPIRRDQHLARTCLPMPPGIFSRLIDIEIMMRVLDCGDAYPLSIEMRDQSGEQRGFSCAAPSGKPDHLHRATTPEGEPRPRQALIMDRLLMTTQSAYPPTVGVLLAGGAARRLGGGDKSLRQIAGKTLLGRARDRIAPQCRAVLLSANGDPSRFANYRLEIVRDDVPGQCGPLAGILAAMDHVAQSGTAEWVLSAPADCPFLPRDLAARLHAERAGAMIAAASSAGRLHPVVALWHITLRADLRHVLAGKDRRKVAAFVARHPHAVADWPTRDGDPFFNVNTPEHLAEAERLAAKGNEA